MLPPQFLSHPPSFSSATPLDRVMAAFGDQPLLTPDRLIVVDAQQRPLGVLALAKLWACYPDRPPCCPPGELVPAQLEDWQPYWESVLTIPAETSVADLGTYLQSQPRGHWVVVDRAGHYQAYIEARELLAWWLPQLSLSPPPQAQDRDPDGGDSLSLAPQEQDWLIALGHALKTPLTSLLGLSSLLLDPRVGALSDRQTRYAHLMRRAIRQLIRMVNEWVDWLRLESGDLILEWDEVDPAGLLTGLLPQFLHSRLGDQSNPPAWIGEFTIDQEMSLPSLRGDRGRLGQSLQGLLAYLLQQGSQPLSLTLEHWGAWLSFQLRGTCPKDQTCPDLIPPGGSALEHLDLSLARLICRAHGGDLVGFCSPSLGYQLNLLILLPPETSPSSRVLVMLVSRAIPIIEQIHGQLQGSSYGLVVVTNPRQVSNLSDRLAPGIVLWHGESFRPNLPPPPNLRGALMEITEAEPSLTFPGTARISPGELAQALIPTLEALVENNRAEPQPLTLLLLHGSAPGPALSAQWHPSLQNRQCCLLQAEDLDQARLLCRIWQPDAIVLDQQGPLSADYLRELEQIPSLATRPLVLLSAGLDPRPSPLRFIDARGVLDLGPDQGAPVLLRQIHQYLNKSPLPVG